MFKVNRDAIAISLYVHKCGVLIGFTVFGNKYEVSFVSTFHIYILKNLNYVVICNRFYDVEYEFVVQGAC